MGKEVVRDKKGKVVSGTLNPKGKNDPDLGKATRIAKEIVAIAIEWYLPCLEDDLKELTPKERLDVICKLMNYVLATKKQEDHSFSNSENVDIRFKFGEWKGGEDGK